MRVRNLAAAALLLGGVITGADAGVVLAFTQNGLTNNFTGTANGAQTQTTLGITDQSVTIGGIENIVGSVQAFFTFSATSVGAAAMNGSNVTQHFTGTFSFWSGVGGTGTKY